MAIRRVTTEVIGVRVEGVDKVAKGYRKLENHQKRLGTAAKQTTRVLKSGARQVGRMGVSFTQAAATAAAFAGALFVVRRAISAIKAPVSLAVDFERQFAMIKTLSSEVGEDVRQELLGLAARAPQTSADIAKAAYQAISASIALPDLGNFMDTASKVAVGGGTTLTSAVDLLSSAVNAYKKQGLSAQEVSDSFFQTVKLGKTTIEEINAVFGRASSLAQYGVSLDDLNSALALLTRQGMPTAEAMTRINALVKTLANPVGNVANKFKVLGFETSVARLKNEGLIAVLSDLNDKTMGSTEILGTLTRRQEANQAMLGLLGNNYNDLIEIQSQFNEKQGATATANEIVAETTANQIALFNALKEDTLRKLGEEVLPMVNEALQSFIDYLEMHSEEIVKTVGAAAETVFAFGKWVAENKDAIVAGITAMFSVLAVQLFIGSVTAATAAFSAAMAGLASAGAATFMATLGAALSAAAAAGPLLAVFVGVGVTLGKVLGNSAGKEASATLEKVIERLQDQVKKAELRARRARRKRGRADKEDEKKVRAEIAAGERFFLAGSGAGFNFGGKRETPALSAQALASGQGPLGTITTADGGGTVKVGDRTVQPVRFETPVMPSAAEAQTLGGRFDQLIKQVETGEEFKEFRKAQLEGRQNMKTFLKKGRKVVETTSKRALTEVEKQEVIVKKAAELFRAEAKFEAEARQRLTQSNSVAQQKRNEAYEIYRNNEETIAKAQKGLIKDVDKDSEETKTFVKNLKESQKKLKADIDKFDEFFTTTRNTASDIVTRADEIIGKEQRAVSRRLRDQEAEQKQRLKRQALVKRYRAATRRKPKAAAGGGGPTVSRAERDRRAREKFIEQQEAAEESARAARDRIEGQKSAEKLMQERLDRDADKQFRAFEALPGTATEKREAEQALALANKQKQLAAEAQLEKDTRAAIAAEEISFAEMNANLTGLRAEADLLKLEQDLQRKKELYRKFGFETTELEKQFGQIRIKIAEDERRVIEGAVRSANMSITQNIGTTIGTIKDIAKAAGASTEVMAILEAGQIAARGIYHKFMAGSEFAEAASMTAKALLPGPQQAIFIAKAKAHTAAGIMHSAQAVGAAVQAGQALYGGFKSGGGSGSNAGSGAAAAGYQSPENMSRLADRERSEQPAAAVMFGDIVLSDVPALFSRDGITALGETISGSVVDAMNRQSAVPGASRLSRRTQRRR